MICLRKSAQTCQGGKESISLCHGRGAAARARAPRGWCLAGSRCLPGSRAGQPHERRRGPQRPRPAPSAPHQAPQGRRMAHLGRCSPLPRGGGAGWSQQNPNPLLWGLKQVVAPGLPPHCTPAQQRRPAAHPPSAGCRGTPLSERLRPSGQLSRLGSHPGQCLKGRRFESSAGRHHQL